MKKALLVTLVAVEDYLEAIHFHYHLVRQSMSAGDTQ